MKGFAGISSKSKQKKTGEQRIFGVWTWESQSGPCCVQMNLFAFLKLPGAPQNDTYE